MSTRQWRVLLWAGLMVLWAFVVFTLVRATNNYLFLPLIYLGGLAYWRVTGDERCRRCNARGQIPLGGYWHDQMVTCPVCDGFGIRPSRRVSK